MSPIKLAIDMDITKWPLRDQLDYRAAVGVNPQYAFAKIAKAFEGAEDGNVPDEALNIPAEYILGMAWVTMRRRDRKLTFDGTIDVAGTSDELYAAFIEAMTALEPEPEERPTKAGRAKTAPARATD